MAELRAPPTRQKPGGRGGIGKRGRRPGAKGAAAAAAAAAAVVASSASAKGSVAANEDNDVDSDGDVAGNGSASNDYMNELEEHINDLGDSWETESLFEDVLEDLTEENQFSVSDPEACTPEESARFRQELRAVGPEEFCRRTVDAGVITAKRLLTAFGVRPPNFLEGEPDESYFGLLSLALSRELLKRAKLPHFNSVEDAVHLLQTCNNIIVLTGAGISTSLGIPDFRSKDIGLYSRLEHLGLSDPQEVFDINLFRQDPTIFYSVARDILPSTDKFTPTHAFIALLQQKGKLLTNYSQNIDNLEAKAGIKPNKLVQCHGSFATASCIVCGYHVDGESIFPTIKAGRIPHCPRCASLRGKKRKGMSRDDDASPALSRSNSIDSNTVGTGSGASTSASTGAPAAARRGRPRGRPARVGRPPGRPRLARRKNNGSSSGSDNEDGFSVPSHGGVMKPDITFFGEPLPDEFSRRLTEIDRYQADLVVVIGTSLKVAPVSEVVPFMPANVPQIYISRTPVNHINFDIDLLGDCDVVVAELCRRAGWDLNHEMVPPKQQVYIETPPGAYSSRHIFTDVTPGLSKAGPAEPVAVKEEKDDKAQTEGDDASYRDEKKPDIAGGDTDNAHNGHDQREDKAAQEETATVMGPKE